MAPETIVTFEEPVEVPGRIPPAGAYVFKLADSESDRNVVRIFDKGKLYATLLAILDCPLQPACETRISCEERPAGSPEAIHTGGPVWPPGTAVMCQKQSLSQLEGPSEVELGLRRNTSLVK